MKRYTSWGRYPQVEQQAMPLQWRDNVLPVTEGTLLPYGQGRSYGDCCLNEDGIVLDTVGLNRFIAFDKQRGVLRCESGVTLHEILQLIIPHGWFLPVTPGTRYVSIGGAVANDVHGKNHHRAGTFGCHINAFELLRSDGQRYLCSKQENPELFRATIAGLGLTGLITWVEIRLSPIRSTYIQGESIRFSTLDEFLDLSASSDQDWEYTVSWIDCAAKGRNLGRGIFYRGNHADSGGLHTSKLNSSTLQLGFDVPQKILNKYTVSMFNSVLYHKHLPAKKSFNKYVIPFFYPL
ncbi:MAG: FAD-binding oxidoreductase, partial [Thioalkalispiraceae bacterium]